MKYLKPLTLLIFFSICQNMAVGQTKTDKVTQLVKHLSWQSVSMNCVATTLILTHQDSTEIALVEVGMPATAKLIAALSDSSKTVIAHIILTRIWDNNASKNSLLTTYIYQNCSRLIGWHQAYNGLVWEWFSDRGNAIRKSEIEKIKGFWLQKIAGGNKILPDVSQELQDRDNKLYPCGKIYENNSAHTSYLDLYQLLDKKSSNSLFQKLWNGFGNDSTNRSYDDCFFINYDSDGLSFRFSRDSTLSTIFIANEYQGEIPYKLRLSDTRLLIEKKIGKPSSSGKYGDNTWFFYKEKSLYLDFDNREKITKFAISKD